MASNDLPFEYEVKQQKAIESLEIDTVTRSIFLILTATFPPSLPKSQQLLFIY